MLYLVLEKIDELSVTYRYYPQHQSTYGLVTVDRKTGEFISEAPQDVDDPFRHFFGHAISHVRRLIRNGEDLPHKRLVAWY